MKSSMDCESNACGRPFGGIGFICKQNDGFRYAPVQCTSDRLMGLHVYFGKSRTKTTTLYGAYMPYNNNTASQSELYMETLDVLSQLIENTAGNTPYLVIGDMNAELPQGHDLEKNWYKCRPYNRHSALLYDFMVDRELIVCNLKQSHTDYTYHKGDNTSYIDYIFMSNYAIEAVINCMVVKDDGCSNSDHLPIICELLLDTGQSAPPVDGSTVGDVAQSTHTKQPTYVKPKWTDPLFVATYTHNLRQELSKIPALEPQRVDRDNAQCVIDSHTNLTNKAMHAATLAGLARVTPSGNTKRRVYW